MCASWGIQLSGIISMLSENNRKSAALGHIKNKVLPFLEVNDGSDMTWLTKLHQSRGLPSIVSGCKAASAVFLVPLTHKQVYQKHFRTSENLGMNLRVYRSESREALRLKSRGQSLQYRPASWTVLEDRHQPTLKPLTHLENKSCNDHTIIQLEPRWAFYVWCHWAKSCNNL